MFAHHTESKLLAHTHMPGQNNGVVHGLLRFAMAKWYLHAVLDKHVLPIQSKCCCGPLSLPEQE